MILSMRLLPLPQGECCCCGHLPASRKEHVTPFFSVDCSGVISAHCNLHLPGSNDSCASASLVAAIISAQHHTQLIFVFLLETRFCHVGQAGLELLTLSDLPALASQIAGITGMSHHNQLKMSVS